MAEELSFEFRRLSEENLADFQFLYQTVFKQKITLSTLRSKYNTSYTGVKHLFYLAYHQGKPVAVYGAVPQQFEYNENLILGVHTCDSITLPEFQRKGLHKVLALKSYELMKAEGVKFVYAFHSENTFHSCKKLDWKVHSTMKGFWVRTENLPVAKALRKVGLTNRILDSRIERIFKPYECEPTRFVNSNSGNGICVHYSEAFFNYKNFTNNLIIELEGVKFWVKISSGIMVGDVNFDNEAALLAAIEKLTELTSKLGFNEILFQTMVGTKLEQTLSNHFSGFESWKVGYLLFDSELPILILKSNFGDLDTF